MNQSEFVNDSSGNVNTVHGNSHFGGQQMRQSVSQLLKYHEMRCLISCRTDISVGTLVELHIPMTDAALKDTAAEVFDNPYHSGNHLITDIQWSFNQTICNTNITVIKDSYENSLETKEVDYGTPGGFITKGMA